MRSLENHMHKFDVISFDIFDTAILRPYIKPIDVFYHIERILGLRGFAKKRVKAESRARKLTRNEDIEYDDIYRLMGDKFKEAFEYEKEFEVRICQQNVEIFSLYQAALKADKQIIFISDMYLPEATIKCILHKNGFVDYNYIFLSSKYKKTKTTGSLFDIALEIIQVEPESVFHIGDNFQSDVEMARSRNINSFFYPKVIDRFLNSHKNIQQLLAPDTDPRFIKDELSLSLIIGLNSIIWHGKQYSSYWSKIGSLYAAPFMFLFTKWVFDNAKKSGVKNLAFAARDGFNLIKIFNYFDSKKDFNAQYVFLPRRVSEYSNIKNDEDLELFFKELGSNYNSLHKFITYFSAESTEIKSRWDTYVQKQGSFLYDDLKRFVIDNKKMFIKASSQKKELVFDYLNQLNLLNKKLAFVDSATIQARSQKLLYRLIKEKNLHVQVLGYYYIIYKWHEILNQKEMRPGGNYIYRTEEWHLMEFFMSSTESPVISIKRERDKIVPVYEDIEKNAHEKIRIRAHKELSKGILLFIDKLFEIFKETETIDDLDTAILHLNNLITNPSLEDVKNLKKIEHSEFNDSVYTSLNINYEKKTELKKIFAQRVQVKRISKENEHFFFGKTGLNCTCNSVNCHLAINVPFQKLNPANDLANICCINNEGEIEIIDSFTRWNFQLGIFMKYHPLSDNEIIYNKYDDRSSVFISFRYNQSDKKLNRLPYPVIDISSDGKYALCLENRMYKEYLSRFLEDDRGANISTENNIDYEKGIVILNLDTGKPSAEVKLLDLWEKSNVLIPLDQKNVRINKLSFNPVGTQFLLSIEISNSKHFFSYIYDVVGGTFTQVDTSNEILGWTDNDHLFVVDQEKYMNSKKKQVFFKKYFEFTISNSKLSNFESLFFREPGKYVFSPNGQFIVKESRLVFSSLYKKLEFYCRKKDKSIVLGYFYDDPKSYTNNLELNFDLNPRWTDDGKFISIDSVHEGYCGIYVIEINEVMKEMDRELETFTSDDLKVFVVNNKTTSTNEYFISKVKIRRVKNKLKRYLKDKTSKIFDLVIINK